MNKNYLYNIIRPIITLSVKLYYNPQIIGKENIPLKAGAIIAGNHFHNFDAILVGCCTKRNMYSLAKKELFKGPLACIFKSLGCIPIDRSKKNKDATDMAINYLKNNNLLYVAPEGTRNKTDKLLLDFKYGTVVMSKKARCCIIPYSITGDYQFRSKNLKIVFGKPLDMSKLSVEEANELLYKKVKKLMINNRK